MPKRSGPCSRLGPQQKPPGIAGRSEVVETLMTTIEAGLVEENAKWVRGNLSGETVVDARSSLLVWEHRFYPAWYFEPADVRAELRPTGEVEPTKGRGDAVVHDLIIAATDGETVLPRAARTFPDSPIIEIRDRVRIEFDALEQWFEEDTEVIIHPRSPYVRIDALSSSRSVKVSIDGTVVAESTRPTILFETGLPARYYLPADDVRMDLLTATDLTTGCPYKGHASYYSVTVDDTVHENLVWWYPDPLPESADVVDLLCFYNEKVQIEVDGVLETCPPTPFS